MQPNTFSIETLLRKRSRAATALARADDPDGEQPGLLSPTAPLSVGVIVISSTRQVLS